MHQRESWKHIDEIAHQQEKLLPLILGKWQLFKENVEESSLVDALRGAFLIGFPIYELRAEEFGWKESDFVSLTMQEFSTYILKSEPEKRIGWLKAIHADEELKRWMLEAEKQFKLALRAYTLSFGLIHQKNLTWDVH